MSKNYTLRNVVDAEDKTIIEAMVAKMEKLTSAEIIPLIVAKSSKSWQAKTTRNNAVQDRANKEFYALGMDNTRDHTGVLIMISLAEHRVEIRAGKAINDAYPDANTWDEAKDALIAGMKTGNPTLGFVNAIEIVGSFLAQRFPCKPDDIDELSNTLIIKE